MRFDHAILAVRELGAAQQLFRSLGFNVAPGGEHSGGYTHNALIAFADGAYLELMAPTNPRLLDDPPPAGPGNYLFLFEPGEGLAGYAFHMDDLDSQVERVRSAGLEIGDPQSGGRRKPDGVELRWRTAMFADTNTPFFLTDLTPREHRVPHDPAITAHSNGATGIGGLEAVVAEPEPAAARLAAVLGAEPEFSDGPPRTAVLRVGEFRVRLTAGQPGPHGELPTAIELSGGAGAVFVAYGVEFRLGDAVR